MKNLYFHPKIKSLFFEKHKGPFSIYIVSTTKVPSNSSLAFRCDRGGKEKFHIAATFTDLKTLKECGYLKATKENLKLHKRTLPKV